MNKRWPLLALLAGCRGTEPPTPLPLRGPAPRAIAVVPRPLAGPADVLHGADAALRTRGYRSPAPAVTAELLGELVVQPNDPISLAHGARLAATDAFLFVEAPHFEVEGEPVRRASWQLRWQLWSASGVELWQHEHAGAWSQRDHDPADPLRRLDDDTPPFVTVPRQPRAFRSGAELAAQLHLDAMQALPVAR
jgi:hypothetical protein